MTYRNQCNGRKRRVGPVRRLRQEAFRRLLRTRYSQAAMELPIEFYAQDCMLAWRVKP